MTSHSTTGRAERLHPVLSPDHNGATSRCRYIPSYVLDSDSAPQDASRQKIIVEEVLAFGLYPLSIHSKTQTLQPRVTLCLLQGPLVSTIDVGNTGVVTGVKSISIKRTPKKKKKKDASPSPGSQLLHTACVLPSHGKLNPIWSKTTFDNTLKKKSMENSEENHCDLLSTMLCPSFKYVYTRLPLPEGSLVSAASAMPFWTLPPAHIYHPLTPIFAMLIFCHVCTLFLPPADHNRCVGRCLSEV